MRDLDNRTEGDTFFNCIIPFLFLILSYWHHASTCHFTEKKAEIEKLAEEYIATVKNLASEQRVEHLQKIQNAYSKCKEFSDDKVQLAMQTYEMVSLLFCIVLKF